MLAMVDAPDHELVRARDFAALVRRYYGPVFALARRLLGSETDARDLAQETFGRALGHFDGFEPDRPFRPWIFAIAANLVRDLLRRRKALPLEPEESLPALAPPDARLLRDENRERLLAAVGRLPFEQKMVVALHFQHDLPYPEIGAALGITVNAVRIRLYRALHALRKELS
jgi:RNA polymerase sigma-70 factor (ECF subfamily)